MQLRNLSEKLIYDHLVEGELDAGSEIGLQIDQTLTQDATGTLVMLELDALGLDRVQTEVSVQYVDHNLIQEDSKNPDDHLFLQSAAKRFGCWFSRPGNGVSHPIHQERFGIPGKTLLGSDSHTCAAGAIGMLAIGAGGLEVAMAMCGHPIYMKMPEILGVRLTGSLPEWVSAKDIILEMLRRRGVKGGVGKIVEYYGPGVAHLTAMDRHVIANMGAELGATATVFPSDERTRTFLQSQEREDDWQAIDAGRDPTYDDRETIDLSSLEPLIALPTSPGNVQRVRDVAGEPVYQCYVGSSANPGYRDFAIVAEIMRGRATDDGVSLDINPTSRQILTMLARDGRLAALVEAGARIHQAGCNGCIGMGQAPATGRISLRTVPRNFPGRSGTVEDKVYLVSPETAAASALTGTITDPRDLENHGIAYPKSLEPQEVVVNREWLSPPLPMNEARNVELVMGPNIVPLPDLDPLPQHIEAPVVLKVGDDISTDEILPAGTRVLPYRSNVPRIADFAFEQIDPDYASNARVHRNDSGHIIIAGENYGQGSSREHAALAPRCLGLRAVIAKSFARIHWQNLVNFGVLPLTFESSNDYDAISLDSSIMMEDLHDQIRKGPAIEMQTSAGDRFRANHALSPRQVDVVIAGSLINLTRESAPATSART